MSTVDVVCSHSSKDCTHCYVLLVLIETKRPVLKKMVSSLRLLTTSVPKLVASVVKRHSMEHFPFHCPSFAVHGGFMTLI